MTQHLQISTSNLPILLDSLGDILTFVGSFVLASEVWQRTRTLRSERGLKRLLARNSENLVIIVDDVPVKTSADAEDLVAAMSARKARYGFGFLSAGFLMFLFSKGLQLILTILLS